MFALVRPFLYSVNESGSNGILAYVLPFLVIRFVASQKMIKKSGLPEWAVLCCSKSDGDTSFQPVHPPLEPKIISTTNKKMHVVWHDHVSPDGDPELIHSTANIFLKRLVCRVHIANLSTMNCA